MLARSIVIDPETGEPILVTYNADGTEAGVVDIGQYGTLDVAVLPAADYRFEQRRLNQYRSLSMPIPWPKTRCCCHGGNTNRQNSKQRTMPP